jgi:putative ABC transport system permease protein
MDVTDWIVRRALLGAVAFGVVILSGACAQDNAPKFAEPPAETYTASTVQLTIDGKAQSVNAAQVTPNFFAAHMRPHLGRLFIDGDYHATHPVPVVVVSFNLWQRLGASPEIIGSPLHVDGRSLIVVGVAEREFNFPKDAELWMPKASER